MTTPEELENMLTSKQLAEASGLSESAIRLYVKRGKDGAGGVILHPVKIGRDLFFPATDIDVLKTRKSPGRPKRVNPDTCPHEWARKKPGAMVCIHCGMFGPTGETL